MTADHDLVIDDEDWIPDAKNLQGDWRIRRPDSPWQSLQPLQAGSGVTALAGQVLRLNGQPLAYVTLRIEDKTAQTDETGRFLLTSITSGWQELLIDARTASRPGRTYGLFEAGVEIQAGQTNVLPYTIWMPKLDTVHAVTIPSPTTAEVVVTTPRIPGLELHIPPQTVIRDHDGHARTQLSITPIPVDWPPFPLPKSVEVPVYFTIQPGAAYVKSLKGGAWIVYPNNKGESPGTRFNFWHYEPEAVGWYVYGLGTVTDDGKQVVPDPGVTIYEFTGAMVAPPEFAPPEGPPLGNGAFDGDPVDLSTGLLVVRKTDLFLPDVLPITLTRTYRPRDTVSRPFGIGTTHPYELLIVGDKSPWTYADIIPPDGSRLHYERISPGTSFSDAVYEHTSTPTWFYKSILAWNGNGWDLKLKDGTVLVFPDAEFASRPPQAALTGIRDRYGNTLTLTRHALRNLTKITSPNGRAIEFTYDTSARITQARANSGRMLTYTYDAGGRLARVTDPTGGVTAYTYDASYRLLTIQDARGIVFLSNEYDTAGKVIKQTQGDGTTYQFTYTPNGGGKATQTEVTDPRGNVRQVTFNAAGYTLTDTRAIGKPEQQTTTYEREAGTNLVRSVTDGLGRKTAYTCDVMGNVTSITRLAGTPGAVTTSFTYEPTFYQVASITDPLSLTTRFTYDGRGNLITATDPLGHQTTPAYNAAGQPISITDPLGNTTQLTYALGDLVAVTNPLGNATIRSIDGVGRLLSLTDPLGHVTRYDYDPLNPLKTITDALGGVTALVYDPNGNLLRVMDARGSPTAYTYDNLDRLVSRMDPLGRSEGYQYDAGWNLIRFTDRKGQVTTFEYDALNRRTKATYADGSTVTYTYDAGNRLTSVVDSRAGAITLTFDNLDRLIAETIPKGTVSYTYDAVGRRTSMTVPGQPPVSYSYDNANRLIQVTNGTSQVTMGYDPAGRRTTLTLPNGVVVTYGYNPASQVTGITYKLGATVLGTLTYEYDNVGNRIRTGGS